MAGRLKQELAKRNTFDSLEQEAHLNIIRTADLLHRALEGRVFTPAGLSDSQYNVLRILRGASADDPRGLRCGEIAQRLITRDPDVTRLIDRLVKRGLVSRQRDREDRRVVRVSITQAGLDLLAPLDAPLLEAHRDSLGSISGDELEQIIKTLERIREVIESRA